jgi:hypothetical protein
MGGCPEPGAGELLLLRGIPRCSTPGALTPLSDPVCHIISKVSAEKQGCWGQFPCMLPLVPHYLTPRVTSSQK